MSFPRAKRFNDVKDCTPSPADYNVVVDKFIELKSPVVSETASSNASMSIPIFRTPTLPKRKKQQPSSLQKLNSKDFFVPSDNLEMLKEKIVELNNKDLYIKDLVEQVDELKERACNLSKEKAQIASEKVEYEKQVEALKTQHENIVNLEKVANDMSQVKSDLINIREEHEQLKLQNKEDLESVLKHLNEFEKQVSTLYDDVKMKENQLEKLNQSYQGFRKTHDSAVNELLSKHLLEMQEMEFEMLKIETEMQKQMAEEKSNCSKKIHLIEKNKSAEISHLQNFYHSKILKIQTESDAKMKQLQEDLKEANILADIQAKEKYEELKSNLEHKLEQQEKEAEQILKECQAISEYNIIQCEVEKNQVKTELNKTVKIFDELKLEKEQLQQEYKMAESNYKSAQENLNKIITELNSTREKLDAEIKNNETQVQSNMSMKRAYELTISRLHETIEALKKRLINSDNDVVQLKEELDQCEVMKIKFEGKCNQLSEDLEAMKTLNEELEIKNESTITLMQEQIKETETSLLGKVKEYQAQAEEELKDLEEALKSKDLLLKETVQQLKDHQDITNHAHTLVNSVKLEMERLEALNTEYKFSNQRLENRSLEMQNELEALRQQNANFKENETKASKELAEKDFQLLAAQKEVQLYRDQVEEVLRQLLMIQEKSDSYYQYCEYYKSKATDYEQEIDEFAEIRKKYIEQSGKYDTLSQTYEEMVLRNKALEKQVWEQEQLIGPFKKQLEEYESERKMLLDQKFWAQSAEKEMALKYAEILGHQNQKQKIKHLIDLKTKNLELNENKKDLELKVQKQSKIIEKLKKDLSLSKVPQKKLKSRSENKENINSPSKALNSSHAESPGGRLRERN